MASGVWRTTTSGITVVGRDGQVCLLTAIPSAQAHQNVLIDFLDLILAMNLAAYGRWYTHCLKIVLSYILQNPFALLTAGTCIDDGLYHIQGLRIASRLRALSHGAEFQFLDRNVE